MISEDLRKKARNVLGVQDDADMDAIRRAYRDLAKKYHPDRDPDDKTLTERFKLISEAYEILSGEKNLRRYSLLKDDNDNFHKPSFDEQAYRKWWMERFKDLF